jgi:GNAT superfamily N-acetyltransferase
MSRPLALSLRPARVADLEPLSAWLPPVASAVGCQRFVSDDALRDALRAPHVLLAEEGGFPACLVYFETGTPLPDAARVRLLAVDPARRRLGIGGRAAMALERRLVKKARRIYVAVPSELGLALYFWLRLGYRPLTQGEWPAPPDRAPSVWMVQALE